MHRDEMSDKWPGDSDLCGGFGHFQPWEFIKLVVRGKQAAEAHYPKWSDLQTTIDESVAGEYGEKVAAVEWPEE